MMAAADLYARGLAGHEPRLVVRDEGGSARGLPLDVWLGPLSAADEEVLDLAAAPVLDIGCGPGRHVLALARRGILALGVDISPAAVRVARSRGAAVIEADVFDRIPSAGAWGSALLLDGNIGIGGDPRALLDRVTSLLAPGGGLLVELAPPGASPRTLRVRLEGASGTSDWFPWARVSAGTLAPIAADAGLSVAGEWSREGRWFALATRAN